MKHINIILFILLIPFIIIGQTTIDKIHGTDVNDFSKIHTTDIADLNIHGADLELDEATIVNDYHMRHLQSEGDKINTRVNGTWDFDDQDFTMGIWLKLASLPSAIGSWTNHTIWGKYAGSTSNLCLNFNQNNNIRYQIDGVDYELYNHAADDIIVVDTWYFLVLKWTESTGYCTLFLNGDSVRSQDVSAITDLTVNDNLSLGRSNYKSLDCYMDEWFVYEDLALTETTIDSIWNNATTPEDMLDLQDFYPSYLLEWVRLEEGTGDDNILGENGIVTGGDMGDSNGWTSY